jgi:hypothetical protein
MFSPFIILVGVAILMSIAALIWPQPQLVAVAALLLGVALLVGTGGGSHPIAPH